MLKKFKENIIFSFSMIFVTSSACDLPLPKIFISYPTDKVLRLCVSDVILEKMRSLPGMHDLLAFDKSLLKTYASEIVQVFNLVTRKFDEIIAIADKLLEYKLEPFLRDYKRAKREMRKMGLDSSNNDDLKKARRIWKEAHDKWTKANKDNKNDENTPAPFKYPMPDFQDRDYTLSLKMFLTNPKVAFEPKAKVNRKIRMLNNFAWKDSSNIQIKEMEEKQAQNTKKVPF